jgi:hypothetical protein
MTMFSKKDILSLVRTAIVALVVAANAAVILPAGGCAQSNAQPQLSEKRSDADQAKLASDKQAAPATKHGPKHR